MGQRVGSVHRIIFILENQFEVTSLIFIHILWYAIISVKCNAIPKCWRNNLNCTKAMIFTGMKSIFCESNIFLTMFRDLVTVLHRWTQAYTLKTHFSHHVWWVMTFFSSPLNPLIELIVTFPVVPNETRVRHHVPWYACTDELPLRPFMIQMKVRLTIRKRWLLTCRLM